MEKVLRFKIGFQKGEFLFCFCALQNFLIDKRVDTERYLLGENFLKLSGRLVFDTLIKTEVSTSIISPPAWLYNHSP